LLVDKAQMLRLKNFLEKGFLGVAAILMAVIIVDISILGKNLTFMTRFTPPSTEEDLKNEAYFTHIQVFILLMSSLLFLLLPFLGYSVFVKSKRYFFPLWIAFMIITAFILLSNVYYLTGNT